ncbi:MAG: hypothetical protein KIS74_11710 [Burkholderiales bacterium]|nr:hypothetical protein [Burkholderiales bacterium]
MSRGARLAPAGLALLAGAALAQDLSLNGTNTVRWERYDTRGNAAGSPYPFTTTTGYDEFVLNLGWQPAPFDRWRGLVAGVVNDSPYRSPFRDVVPERLLVARENGDAAIPYRAEAGDFFAFASTRTQQRPLKGASVELQPVPESADFRTSILAFAGAAQSSWRNLQWSDDNTVGLSWLSELARARLALNVLRNSREANAPEGTPRRTQEVASVAAEAPFALGDTRWRAEAEAAALRGDHDGPPGGTVAWDRRDSGLFAQLTGSHLASGVGWRLRGERYGADYRPYGTAVVAGRRSLEAHLTGATSSGLAWRARLQEFRDGFEGDNPLDTRVLGAGLAGPWRDLAATVSADVFRQDIERADATLDQRNLTANLFLSRPFGQAIGQLGLLYQRLDDRAVADASPRTRQVSASIVLPLAFAGLQGSVAPGFTWRDVSDAATATRDLQATLQLQLSGGPHRLSLSAGHLSQDPVLLATPDVATVNFGLDYRFRWGPHEFGVDVTTFDRRPSPGERTEAWRAGVTWTLAFDHRATAAPVAAPAISASSGAVPRDAGLLAAIAPGDRLDDAATRMASAGYAGSTSQPGAVVWEARPLPEIEGRQRVAVIGDSGRVERVAVIVSLAPAGGGEDAARVFERVQRTLIELFGRPSSVFEEGEFGPGFARDVAAGRLIRIAEWPTQRGVIRLGIPRRLDGVARIEIHHARGFASPRDTAWGIESIR